jgi:hypothetical protein
MGRRTVAWWLLGGAAVLLAAPAAAQRTRFNPSISVGAGRTDNVEYTAVEETSDTVAHVTAALPVERAWRTGTFRFAYEPSFFKYDSTTSLDRFEHHATAGWNRSFGRRTRLDLSADFSRTQQQGLRLPGPDQAPPDEPAPVVPPDALLTQRTERDSFGAWLRLDRTAGERWSWGLTASGSDYAHDAIEDFNPNQPAGFAVEDRTEYAGAFDLSRAFSRADSMGLRYEHRWFELDASPDQDSDLLSLTYRRTVGRKLWLDLGAGGSRTTGDGAGGSPGDDERSELQGNVGFHRAFRHVDLGLGVSHRPTSGGHLEGTSTDTSAELRLSGVRRRDWFWDVVTGYVHRDPTQDGAAATRGLAAAGQVERMFLEVLSVRFATSFADQSEDDPTRPDPSAWGAELALVWYPRGRAEAARGEKEGES